MQKQQKKNRQQTSLSHRGSQPNLVQKFNLLSPTFKHDIQSETPRCCRFCQKSNYIKSLYHIRNKQPFYSYTEKLSLIKLLSISLPLKYSQSQTYYYTKPINDYLNNQRTSQVISLKEQISFSGIDGDEWLRRFYQKQEHAAKIKLLTEYYRFHNEIPRLFMLPISDIMNNYHDKKRRIEYFRIVKEIEDENKKNPDKPPKEIVGDKPDIRKDSIDYTQRSGVDKEEKFYGNLLDDITIDQKKNISITVQELNQKLEEIVKGQKTKVIFEEFDKDFKQFKQQADEDDKLAKFIAFLKDHDKKEEITEKKKQTFKKRKDLQLDEEILQTDNINNIGPKTVQPTISNQFQFAESTRKTSKVAEQINLPKSARNSNQQILRFNIKSIFNQFSNPFFLSEALLQKIQKQQQQYLKEVKIIESKQVQAQKSGLQVNSQYDKLSPRGNSSSNQQQKQIQSPSNQMQKQLSKQWMISQQIQQQLQQNIMQKSKQGMNKQFSAANILKSSIQQQGFQGSQESYQGDVFQIMSAKNAAAKQFFPSNQKLNSSLKNSSKLNVITAESSPNHKIKQSSGIVGSQTHRVTSQGNLLKQQILQQQQSQQQLQKMKNEFNSKESLNKILSPINPFLNRKQISDNFLLQIQTIQQYQSSLSQKQPLVKSTVVNQQNIINQIKRCNRGPSFRKSLEQNMKIQQRPKQSHQHTKSDINTDQIKQI